MDKEKNEALRNDLAKDLENYHQLVYLGNETFSWKTFADFLLSKGWTNNKIIGDKSYGK